MGRMTRVILLLLMLVFLGVGCDVADKCNCLELVIPECRSDMKVVIEEYKNHGWCDATCSWATCEKIPGAINPNCAPPVNFSEIVCDPPAAYDTWNVSITEGCDENYLVKQCVDCCPSIVTEQVPNCGYYYAVVGPHYEGCPPCVVLRCTKPELDNCTSDNCIISLALNENDSLLCNRLKDNAWHDFCVEAVNARTHLGRRI